MTTPCILDLVFFIQDFVNACLDFFNLRYARVERDDVNVKRWGEGLKWCRTLNVRFQFKSFHE